MIKIPEKTNEEKSCTLFCNEKVNYPIKFRIKIIFIMDSSVEELSSRVVPVFESLSINHADWMKRESSSGKYVTISAEIDVQSEEFMKKLYLQLSTVDGVKTVI